MRCSAQKRRVRAPPKLTRVRGSPDLRKGVIRIERVRAAPRVAFASCAQLTHFTWQSDDDLTHFTWRERTSAEAELVRGRRTSRSRRAGTR